MHAPTRSHAGFAATGIAVVGIAAMAATPLAPATQSQSPPTVAQDVRLTAATVPPGGLVTSFLGNQVIYCSIICPLLVQTGVTPVVTTLQTPGTFATALQSGDLLKAIGITAASVTGPTNAAATAAIVADGTRVAPRALNAFETGVVGLLNVVPAAAGGLPGIVTAIQTARQDTFTALFTAFNDVLFGAFQTPDAVAQELAASGDPVRGAAAGVNTAAGAVTAAGTVIADSVVTAVNNVGAAAGQLLSGNGMTQIQKSSTTTTSAHSTLEPPRRLLTTTKHANAQLGSSHPLRDVASTVRDAARTVIKKASVRTHRTEWSNKGE